MEIYTLDSNFREQELVDKFESAIWTERYKGDGDFKIIVPVSQEMLSILSKGTLMLCKGSNQPMILETRDIKDDLLEVAGVTLTQWLNNRIIRTTNDPKVREYVETGQPGAIILYLAQKFAMPSNYNNGTIDVGIASAITTKFPIPGLVQGAYDTSGASVDISIPFGPLYDPMKQIADTYDIGIAIWLSYATPTLFQLVFETYIGENRTSDQSTNPVIQFSKEMNTFVNIHDLESIVDHRNYLIVFPSSDVPVGYTNGPGIIDVSNAATGFDFKVFQGFADRLPEGSPTNTQIYNALIEQAKIEKNARKIVQLVDGEIVQLSGVKYGEDYFLGDIVEAVGNTGVVQQARVTEYIRSQDPAGEKSYPTLTFLD